MARGFRTCLTMPRSPARSRTLRVREPDLFSTVPVSQSVASRSRRPSRSPSDPKEASSPMSWSSFAPRASVRSRWARTFYGSRPPPSPRSGIHRRTPMADDCLFCRIVRREIPAKLVAEDEHCVAFRDINPQAPLHVLVIPREHVPSLDQRRDAELLGRLSLMAAEIARKEGVAASGYRTVMNTNAAAGQTVFHVHLHLLGGRPMHWPPG